MKYSERLKAAREHKGLTQSQLAELSGVKQPTISQLENSATAEGGSIYTAQFAYHCGVSAIWLADEIGAMVPLVYQTSDPKIIAAAKLMEPLPEYGKDAVVKDVTEVAELIARAKHNGTDG